MQKSVHFIKVFLLFIMIFALPSCEGLSPEEEFDRTGRAGARRDATLTALAQPSSEPLTGITKPSANSSQIALSFTAKNTMDLPTYRSNLSNPIMVERQGASPWPASMRAERQDDYEKLGALQPGIVRQTTTFEGTFDQAAGKLTGTLTHKYSIDAQATKDALAARVNYSLTCTLEAQRVGSSDAIEGVCNGKSTNDHKIPGNSSYDRFQEKSVSYTVSGRLPAELQK